VTNLFAWYGEAGADARRALWAAALGWMLDAMDVMLYAFALGAIQKEFALTSGAAGALASVTLLASAVGGGWAGVLSDRYGRARVLSWSILIYSIATAATSTAGTLTTLVFWRAVVGLGLGAEWSAGSVLVAETWPARHRGKAIGLMQAGWAVGYILAALLAAAVLPRFGWRWLFAAGVLPALLAVWVRRGVGEPQIWLENRGARRRDGSGLLAVLHPPLARRAIIAASVTASLLIAYWGLFTWIPAYLAAPIERGGAGLGIVKSSAWIIPMQIGAFIGYTSFGILADRFGRRPMFLTFVLVSAVLVPIYGAQARSATALLVLGPLVGLFGHGYFSVFGAMLAELFPTHVRGAAQGLCYNSGRALSALAPFAIGWLADRLGYGPALGSTAAFFALGGALIFLLPETKGKALE
jgi:MFS family permease